MILRLALTGSRAWTDAGLLRDVLDGYASSAVGQGATGLLVMHGGCYPTRDPQTGRIPARSADWLAHRWVHDLPHPLPVTEKVYPADWSAPCQTGCQPQHRRTRRDGSSYCPAAGNYRNDVIVADNPDRGVAFQLDKSSGTADCIRRMEAAGIPVQRIVRSTAGAR